jgi:hypothetical protein
VVAKKFCEVVESKVGRVLLVSNFIMDFLGNFYCEIRKTRKIKNSYFVFSACLVSALA